MMRRWIALLLCLWLLPVPALALESAGGMEETVSAPAMMGIQAEGECGISGSNLHWTLDENGLLTVTGTGAMANYLQQPPDDLPPWNPWRLQIKSVKVCSGVTTIGNNAFASATALTDVTLPGGLVSIGDNAFYYDHALTCINLPASLTKIGKWAFGQCHHLPSLTLPAHLVTIGANAFHSCHAMTSVTIPASVFAVGEGAFTTCSGLKEVTITSGVKGLYDYTFGDCPNLEKVYIPASVVYMEDEVFAESPRVTLYGSAGSYAQQFAGSHTIPFLSNLADAKVTIPSVTYSGKAQTPKPTVTLNGKTLTGGQDYIFYAPSLTNAGTYNLSLSGIGRYYGTKKGSFTIQKAANPLTVNRTGATIEMGSTVTVTGKGQGTISYVSGNKSIATVSSKGVVKGVAPGTVKITVKAAGNSNYKAGSKTVTVKVVCPQPTISSVKNSKQKTMTVTWGKKAGVTGYLIQYSTDKRFQTGAKTVTVKGASVTARDIGSLKQGKTYYVRMRTYYKDTKTVSKWSAVKSVAIKK